MAYHFTREYIDDLLSKTDITQVMRHYNVQIKEGIKHNYFIADFCCGKKDFDNGRIRKSTGFYKCLACGQGGHAITFLERVQGKSFPQAVITLSEMFGIPLPSKNPIEEDKENRKKLALKLTAAYYQRQNNFEYFLSRGISIDVLKKYQAGYAPGGRRLRNYLEEQGFTKEELLEFKLINHKGLDRFYYRAIIPIYKNGQVIDLYGRAVHENVEVKHLYLYGVPFLGGYDFIKQGQLVTIFESFIDQLVAESHGIYNGTNPGGAHKFTKEHGRMLKKKGIDKIVILYDGDDPGKEGSLETGKITTSLSIDTWVANLPQGQDPAQLLNNVGIDKFKELIQGKTYKQFELSMILKNYDLSDIQAYINEVISN